MGTVLSQIGTNVTKQTIKQSKSPINDDHKTDIIQSIASIGNIHSTITIPILSIKNIASNSIDININDEDILNTEFEAIFEYEIQFNQIPINVDNEINDEKYMNDLNWTTQVINS